MGLGHACVRLRGGAVKCWGAGRDGQLGDGANTDRLTPVTVQGVSDAEALAAGGAYSCARLGGGTVKCWGKNAPGQLGDGSNTKSSVPVTVTEF
jgi:alpha-tubulin suppressor-like RCC1 family protein